MAKLYASRIACEVADDCVQILGGYGYMKEYEIERAYRDVRLNRIGAGTDEVMLDVIGRYATGSSGPGASRRGRGRSVKDAGRGPALPPFGEEHEELRETVARFVAGEIAPNVERVGGGAGVPA